MLQRGCFNAAEPGLFDPIIGSITSADDPWMTAADFAGFVACPGARRRGLSRPRPLDPDEYPQ